MLDVLADDDVAHALAPDAKLAKLVLGVLALVVR